MVLSLISPVGDTNKTSSIELGKTVRAENELKGYR